MKSGLAAPPFQPLLSSDVTGSEIYREQTGTFEFQPGPLFGNLVLADEINRAPAKVQAALLEAMEERQVTVAGKTHKLPELFLVLATQNPIEQEGNSSRSSRSAAAGRCCEFATNWYESTGACPPLGKRPDPPH
jgi:hypothetical protein